MKTWEAVKAMEEGKKVRRKDWNEDEYIYLDQRGVFVEEDGIIYELNCHFDDWEVYDNRKDICKELKDLYKVIINFDKWEEYNAFINKDDIVFNSDYLKELIEQLKEMNKFYKLDK